MARRPHIASREQLTAEELLALRQKLAGMSHRELEIEYRATHRACAYEILGRLPSPQIMQELVQTWKALRKWKKP